MRFLLNFEVHCAVEQCALTTSDKLKTHCSICSNASRGGCRQCCLATKQQFKTKGNRQMSNTWYCDLIGGNDSDTGASFAQRVKTLTRAAALAAAGDTVRV